MINAFHPDYVKTYMPELLDETRIESRQTKAGQTLSRQVEKKRKIDPTHGTIQGVSSKEIPSYMTKPKEMMYPNRATLTRKK